MRFEAVWRKSVRETYWLVGLLVLIPTAGCTKRGVSPRVQRASRQAAAFTPALSESPRAASGKAVSIGGEVFGPDGRPMPDAQVFVFYRSGHHALVAEEVPPDGAGRFSNTLHVENPYQPVCVMARAEGFALDWQGVYPGQQALLQLGEDPVSCTGTVTDATGKPVAGARVVARGLVPLPVVRWQESPFVTSTNAAGRFAFEGLQPGTSLTVAVFAEGHARRTVGWWDGRDKGNVEVALKPESTISGRVLHDGQPVAGVTVFCGAQHGTKGGGDDEAVSADDGSYTLHHLSFGTFNVIVRQANGLTAPAIEGVKLSEGEHYEAADITLSPGGLVRGAITEQGTGKPIEGVSLLVAGPVCPPSGRGRDPTFSGADGRYELRLPSGRHRIRVLGMSDGGPRAIKGADEQWVEVEEGEVAEDVDFAMTPARRDPADGWGGKLALTVTPLPDNETITAYEPLLARVEIRNVTQEAVEVEVSGGLTARVQVRDADGNLVGITPRPVLPADFICTSFELKPGESKSRTMVISASCAFDEAGEYTVRVQRLALLRYSPVIAEGSCTVEVLPFNANRLKARCEALLEYRHTPATLELPWIDALCSIRHDIALPYLERIATEWGKVGPCLAMRRVRSEAGDQLVAKLAKREDPVGKAARSAMELPLDKDAWFLNAE
jgi:hypothetical protein